MRFDPTATDAEEGTTNVRRFIKQRYRWARAPRPRRYAAVALSVAVVVLCSSLRLVSSFWLVHLIGSPVSWLFEDWFGIFLVLVDTAIGYHQEEAAFFGLPAIIMRDTTPRWEGIQAGIAVLCSVDPERVLEAAARFLQPRRLDEVAAVPCPYGAGDTGRRIAALLRQPDIIRVLSPRECDLTLPGADAVTDLVDSLVRWP